MKKTPKVKHGQPPIQRLGPWLQAMGVFSVAAVIALMVKGLSKPITYLSSYSGSQMKEVFRGNDTWVVLCHNTSAPLHKRFDTALQEIGAGAWGKASGPVTQFGVLDCGGTLPSGKTVIKKFALDDSVKPLIFVTAPGMKPQQAPKRHLESNTGFLKWLRATIDPRVHTVGSTKDMETKCLSKGSCAVLLKPLGMSAEQKAQLKAVMYKHRGLRFASVESAKHVVSIEKTLGLQPDQADAAPVLVYFRQNKDASGKPIRGKTDVPRWGLEVYKGDWEADLIAEWLNKQEKSSGGAGFTPVTRLPTVMQRKHFFLHLQTPKPKADKDKPKAGTDKPKEGQGSKKGSESPQDPYAGKTIEEILEEQAKREAAKREQMEREAETFISSGGGMGSEDIEEEVISLD
ncbi:unnamed protein product [Chrysoparadoxa australica]